MLGERGRVKRKESWLWTLYYATVTKSKRLTDTVLRLKTAENSNVKGFVNEVGVGVVVSLV